VVKPAVSYGWDFHPRLIPLGVWDETYIEVQPISFVENVNVNYNLNEQLDRAAIKLEVKGRNLEGNFYTWRLFSRDNREVLKMTGQIEKPVLELKNELSNPVLWWPHDQGDPYLYSWLFELQSRKGKAIQKVTGKTGFRKIILGMNKGTWEEPAGYPKSRSHPPAQFEVNGRRIFIKGTNWVCPEIFPGTITRERYKGLLERVRDANLSMVRVWGGGIVNKESFYDLCDELGILVWQEFPLACNLYPDDPYYLQVLRQEATSIILRLKKHACLALWSGGNELFNAWSGMTDQSLALRMLNGLTYEIDPQTPFIATSPLSGMAHGHYVFRDWSTQEEVYSRMERSHYTAYTEFGMPGPSSPDILRKIIPADELWPPREGTSWQSHHAFKAWIGDTHLVMDMLTDYFGPSSSLEELVERGQLLQGEGFKAIYEAARRQKPYCSMALNWCFNEPWYTAANNSIVSYPNAPKAAYYEIRNACRPFCASAEIKKFKWQAGDEFITRVWLLNDLPAESPGGKIRIRIIAGRDEMELLRWEYDGIEANTNLKGPETKPFILPEWKVKRFRLVVEVADKPEFGSEYTLLYKPSAKE
jgi:beta-mannosidase